MEIITNGLPTIILKKIFIFIPFLFVVCANKDINPKFVEYLKAEKNLRKRVSEEQGLEDSIKVLQQKYNIDSEKELSKLKNNPKNWIELIKKLKIEK